MKKRFAVIAAVLVLVFALTACGASRCTMENYNKIEVAKLNPTTFQYEGGMTLSEVEEILGDYANSSSSTVMGHTATAYVWGNENKNITVSFYGGRAILKSQYGL